MKTLLCAVVSLLLTACSLNNAGLRHLNAGRDNQAFEILQKCAAEGDPACLNNLGLIYEGGRAGVSDLQLAIDLYTLSARYGIPVAQQNLIRLGQLVPTADRSPVYTPSTTRSTTKPNSDGCTNDFQCGYGNLCVKPEGSWEKGRCVTPVDEYGTKTYETPPPSSYAPHEVGPCTSTYDCPFGFSCDKQPGRLAGICIKKE